MNTLTDSHSEVIHHSTYVFQSGAETQSNFCRASQYVPIQYNHSKRGQATIEFMLFFLVSIAFITILISSMGLAKKNASAQGDIISKTVELEELSRIMDTYSNIGLIMLIDLEQTGYQIKGNRIVADYGKKTIVVEGIFENKGVRYEPI